VIKLKNRELETLRGSATTILEQRTETEQFFLQVYG
jgi:hypothetical protein